MKKTVSKLLCALALSIAAVAQADAAEVQSSDLSMSYQDFLFTPTSQQGGSFTFAFAHPDWTPDGTVALAISRYAFDFVALPGYALTGKMSVHLDASYQLDASAGASANMELAFDVLMPRCDQCGPYDSVFIDTAGSATTSTPDPAGSLSIDTGNHVASDSYDRLIMYVVNDYILTSGYGQIYFNSITVSAETVAVSAVPELPPFLMLAMGLAVVGAGAWLKRGIDPGRSLG